VVTDRRLVKLPASAALYFVEQTTAPVAGSAKLQETLEGVHSDFAQVQDRVSLPHGLG
jgi:N-formylglutamate amidohydrolase